MFSVGKVRSDKVMWDDSGTIAFKFWNKYSMIYCIKSFLKIKKNSTVISIIVRPILNIFCKLVLFSVFFFFQNWNWFNSEDVLFINWDNFGNFKLLRKSSHTKATLIRSPRGLERTNVLFLRITEKILLGPVIFFF